MHFLQQQACAGAGTAVQLTEPDLRSPCTCSGRQDRCGSHTWAAECCCRHRQSSHAGRAGARTQHVPRQRGDQEGHRQGPLQVPAREAARQPLVQAGLQASRHAAAQQEVQESSSAGTWEPCWAERGMRRAPEPPGDTVAARQVQQAQQADVVRLHPARTPQPPAQLLLAALHAQHSSTRAPPTRHLNTLHASGLLRLSLSLALSAAAGAGSHGVLGRSSW